MKFPKPTIAKTATYGLMHMTISFFIAWFVAWYMSGDVTASFHVALGISLLEPSIQIGGYYLHEKAWHKWGKNHPDQAAPDWNMGASCGHHHHHHDGHDHKH